jgi:Kef-type K+ transport system membrane component KefB
MWLSRSLAILSGWNIAVVCWFLLAIGAAILTSKADVDSSSSYWLGILVVFGAIAMMIGYFVGRRLYPKFNAMKTKTAWVFLIALLFLTFVLFPRPFTYVTS